MDVVERLTLEAAQADTMIAREHRHRYEFAAGLSAGLRVLDLCCGSGYGSAILATSAREVIAVDNDVATVETARVTFGAEAPNVSFELANAAAFLDGDIAGRFDVVVCFEGLEHLHDLDHTLAKLRGYAGRGVRIIASLLNDKLSDQRNRSHVTQFGYDNAVKAFAEFPSVVMVPQFLAEGSLICPAGATETEVDITFEDRYEPEYANHFIFCVGFPSAEVQRAHRGKIQLSTSPIFNRWSENLKQGASALRRENARLGRDRLGKAGSAAASALAAIAEREAQLAQLAERCRAAETRVVELEAALVTAPHIAREKLAVRAEMVLDASPARALVASADEDPNSWEHRRRRAAEVLIPWIEQTVPLAGKTVLEYGCGNAAVGSALAERAARVIGIDLDEHWIDDGRDRIRGLGLDNIELELHPLPEIRDATAAHRGQVDVFVLYAVLEHLTVAERLDVLRLAREVVKPGGAIVVCETPNRLIYFDHHTAQMPFFHLLPDELALDYYPRSTREDFKAAIDSALRDGRDAGLEAIVRSGRGVSFHEFEIVFGDLSRHVLASNYDPLLFGERPVHPEEVVLARYLSRTRPDLAPVWSRYWLDLILSPTPVAKRPPLLRPWTAETIESANVGWTAWENLLLKGGDATLRVTLPQPTARVVVGSVTLDGHWLSLSLRPEGSDLQLVTRHRAETGVHAFTAFNLAAPAQGFALGASEECHLVFIGYDD
jgi:2-polyprenyl-3-methyl-5-hydroxy-6-metoxy-1,4-benzoquinol methylase